MRRLFFLEEKLPETKNEGIRFLKTTNAGVKKLKFLKLYHFQNT